MAWLDTEITSDHLALDNVQSEAAGNALLGQGFDLFSDEIQIARADQIQNVNGNEFIIQVKSNNLWNKMVKLGLNGFKIISSNTFRIVFS